MKSSGKGGDRKKWQNVNKDRKSDMKKEGTTYYWCKTCGYSKGRWVNMHKSKDCRYKKKKEETSEEEEVKEGNLAMEIAECLKIL